MFERKKARPAKHRNGVVSPPGAPHVEGVLKALRWRDAFEDKPRGPMPHIAMLIGEAVRFGRYSEVNHCFQMWRMGEYKVVHPDYYADLGG